MLALALIRVALRADRYAGLVAQFEGRVEFVAAEGAAEISAADAGVVDDFAGVPSKLTRPSLMISARSQTRSVWATL